MSLSHVIVLTIMFVHNTCTDMFFPCVGHGMSIQIMFTLESLITMTTLIGLFPNMCLIMLNQVAFLLRNSYHNDYIYRGFHMCVSLNTLQDHNLLRTLEHNNNIYVAYP